MSPASPSLPSSQPPAFTTRSFARQALPPLPCHTSIPHMRHPQYTVSSSGGYSTCRRSVLRQCAGTCFSRSGPSYTCSSAMRTAQAATSARLMLTTTACRAGGSSGVLAWWQPPLGRPSVPAGRVPVSQQTAQALRAVSPAQPPADACSVSGNASRCPQQGRRMATARPSALLAQPLPQRDAECI